MEHPGRINRPPKTRITRHFAKGLGLIAIIYLLTCLILWRYQRRLMFFPSSHLKSTPANVGLEYQAVWLTPKEGSAENHNQSQKLNSQAPKSQAQLGEKKTRGKVHSWWIPSKSDTAPVLLYLHGNGSNLGDLPHRAQRFHQLGYAVFLIDYRGYGRSSGPFPSEQQVYADAEAAWQYLTQEQQIPAGRIVIYGRSIGGAIALNLASDHPQAAGVIVEASFTSMKAMVNRQLPLPILPVDWLLTQKFESLEKVRSLPMPLIFLHGTADTVIPVDMSQRLYHAATHQKHLLIIENAGHSDLPTIGGERYTHTIQTFIEQYAK